MSTDSTWDVQSAVFTKLSADTGLTSLLNNGADSILDFVPEDTLFPYIVISDVSGQPLDTSVTSAYEIILTIHSYSQGEGMKEARQIMSAIYDSLHRTAYNVPNQTLVLSRLLNSQANIEGDGQTRHGVQQFQIITDPI